MTFGDRPLSIGTRIERYNQAPRTMTRHRTTNTKPPRSHFAHVGLLVLLLVVACSEARPAVDAWSGQWGDLRSQLPADSTSAQQLSDEQCRDILGLLRQRGPDLIPAPDGVADETVRDWLEEAEATFFECPPSDGFGAAYERLVRLEAEIEAVIEIDRGS